MKANAILSAREVAGLLRVSLVKILRWAHEGKIPCRMENGQPVFLRGEVRIWAAECGLSMDESAGSRKGGGPVRQNEGLVFLRAVRAGGVRFGVEGQDLVRVLENAVRTLPFSEERKPRILEELLDREEAASTGLGRGVAVPHPRKPLETGFSEPLLPLFFLKEAVDFSAVDGLPVDILFMMFSPTTKVHLELLARLSLLLRKDGFLEELRSSATEGEVLSVIESAERA